MTDSPNTDRKLALSIAVKLCNDTAGINGLSPTLLVFETVPQIPIVPKELPKQSKRLKAMRSTRSEMTRAIAADRIRTALTRNVPTAADNERNEGGEVLMLHEKPRGRWVEAFVVHKRDDKMLVLDTGDRFIVASIDKVKAYMTHDSHQDDENTMQGAAVNNHTDGEVAGILDQYLPSAPSTTSVDAIQADEFVIKTIHSDDDCAKQNDFVEAKRTEIKGLQKTGIWAVADARDVSPDAIVLGFDSYSR